MIENNTSASMQINPYGTEKSLAELQSVFFIIFTLEWDTEVWILTEATYPVLRN